MLHDAPGTGKTVALTFDDGPGLSTPHILKILQRNGIRATFFFIGVQVERLPELAQQVRDAGYLIGNHTYRHPNLAQLSEKEQRSQMVQMDKAAATAGLPFSCVMRPPFGSVDRQTVAVANSLGKTVWHWNVYTTDAEQPLSERDSSWVRKITDQATSSQGIDNAVVLMHDGRGEMAFDKQYRQYNTEDALQAVIDHYKERGYRFVDLAGRS